MLSLRRIRAPQAVFRRCNATLQQGSAATTDAPPPPVKPASKSSHPNPAPVKPATVKVDASSKPTEVGETAVQTQGRRRPGKQLPQRPKISAENPRKWNRPIKEGVLPAYDLALKVLQTDSFRLKEEAKALKEKIVEVEGRLSESKKVEGEGSDGVAALEKEVEKLYQKLRILEVQGGVNLPENRWKVRNAMADMTNPIHRHLVEQRWRKEGDLDLLMERLHQMQVIPDVLGDLRPTIDVHVAVDRTHADALQTGKKLVTVEPGTFLYPRQTTSPPYVSANVFHTDTRLYTLLLVDPDVPNEETQSFSTYLHWLKPNIPLSATQTSFINDLNTHTRFIPPHPQKGTPYHRYVLLMLEQPSLNKSGYTLSAEAHAQPGVPTSVELDIPVVTAEGRQDFDVRAFMSEHGLDGTKGGGAHMWREVWDEKVSKIYEQVLKQPEPRYGRPPKYNPYAELKHQKRYI